MTKKNFLFNNNPFFRCFVFFLLFSLCLFLPSCAKKKKTSGTNSFPMTAPDFSSHSDGSLLSEEEIKAYQKYICSGTLIQEGPDSISGTHTGLFSTVVKITLYHCTDQTLLLECFSLLAGYETVLSRTMPGSELYRINYSDETELSLSSDLSDLLATALSYKKLSNGHFDVTIAPLSELWNFSAEKPSVPKEEDITRLLPFCDSEKLSLDENVLSKPKGFSIDLGAIAKGFLCDRLLEFLNSKGAKDVCISLGGNAAVSGSKAPDTPYRIGVAMPFSDSGVAGILEITDGSVVTSGIYERCFLSNRHLYHHILDAKTGYPIENNLLSVTIVCKNSARADALSTTCFLLGKEEGTTLINELSKTEPVYAMFLTGEYIAESKSVENLSYSFSDGFLEKTGFTYPE